jgi:hypothetical protein
MTSIRNTLSGQLAVVAVLAAFTFAAPAAFAQKQAQKAGENIQGFRSNVVEMKGQVGKTLEALNGVVASGNGGDSKAAFKKYSDEMKATQKQIDKTKSYAQKMKEQGQAYFKDWEEKMGTMTNPELKQKATARRAELQAEYEKIQGNITQAKETGSKFWKDLQDLQKYYATDLSPKGIAGSADMVTKANADGKVVDGLFDQVVAAVDQVLANMGMPPAAK